MKRLRQSLSVLLALALLLAMVPAVALADTPEADANTGQTESPPPGESTGGEDPDQTEQMPEGAPSDGTGEPSATTGPDQPQAGAASPASLPIGPYSETGLTVHFDAGDQSSVKTHLDTLLAQHPTIWLATELTVTGAELELDALRYLATFFSVLEVLHMPTQQEIENTPWLEQGPFQNHATLQMVDLPSATLVGDFAFNKCAALREINLPSVRKVGGYAFCECTLLGAISLPLVEEVGNFAFASCTNLSTVELPQVKELRWCAFENCESIGTIDFPHLTTIGNAVFKNCINLTSVNLPQTQTVGEEVFSGCTALTAVSLPKTQTIGFEAFQGCTALTTVSLPQAQTIGRRAFGGCTALTTVSLPQAQTIGNGAFQYCISLTAVNMPQTQTIGEEVFSGCTALTAVSLPKAQTIGYSAFSLCEKLHTINLPQAQTIGDNAFMGCTSLTTLTLPGTLGSIGINCFLDTNLTNLILQGGTLPTFIGVAPAGIFGVPGSLPATTVTVWVPDAAVGAYQSALVPNHIQTATQVKSLEGATFPTGIQLDYTSYTLAPGVSFALTATVLPADALDATYYLESSDTAVAVVDNLGNVTAIAEGTATITVTSVMGSNVTATCTITVRANSTSTGTSGGDAYEPATATTTGTVAFTGAPTGPIGVGTSFTVTPKPDDRTGSAGWTWDDTFFSATFNSPATFTALKEGTSTITYTSATGVKSSFTVTVGTAQTEPGATEPSPTGDGEGEPAKQNPTTGRHALRR